MLKGISLSCDVKLNTSHSTYYMLQRLEEEHMPVVAVLNDKTVCKKEDPALNLTPQEWAPGKDLVSVLKPFEALTRVLSAENNVSVSSVLPIIHGLWKSVSVKRTDSKGTAGLALQPAQH